MGTPTTPTNAFGKALHELMRPRGIEGVADLARRAGISAETLDLATRKGEDEAVLAPAVLQAIRDELDLGTKEFEDLAVAYANSYEPRAGVLA